MFSLCIRSHTVRVASTEPEVCFFRPPTPQNAWLLSSVNQRRASDDLSFGRRFSRDLLAWFVISKVVHFLLFLAIDRNYRDSEWHECAHGIYHRRDRRRRGVCNGDATILWKTAKQSLPNSSFELVGAYVLSTYTSVFICIEICTSYGRFNCWTTIENMLNVDEAVRYRIMCGSVHVTTFLCCIALHCIM